MISQPVPWSKFEPGTCQIQVRTLQPQSADTFNYNFCKELKNSKIAKRQNTVTSGRWRCTSAHGRLHLSVPSQHISVRSNFIATSLLSQGLSNDFLPLNLHVKISSWFVRATYSSYLIKLDLISFFVNTKTSPQHFVSNPFSSGSSLAQTQTVPVQTHYTQYGNNIQALIWILVGLS